MCGGDLMGSSQPKDGEGGGPQRQRRKERGRESISFLSVSVAPPSHFSLVGVSIGTLHTNPLVHNLLLTSLYPFLVTDKERECLFAWALSDACTHLMGTTYLGRGLLLRGLAMEKKTNWPAEREHMHLGGTFEI